MAGVDVPEYLNNIRELLRTDAKMFRIMVSRQVQGRLLPQVEGTRAELEGDLWDLLVFCLDGHEVIAPPLDDEVYGRAQEATEAGASLATEGKAAFPRAATAVLAALDTLREVGVYPPPKLR